MNRSADTEYVGLSAAATVTCRFCKKSSPADQAATGTNRDNENNANRPEMDKKRRWLAPCRCPEPLCHRDCLIQQAAAQALKPSTATQPENHKTELHFDCDQCGFQYPMRRTLLWAHWLTHWSTTLIAAALAQLLALYLLTFLPPLLVLSLVDVLQGGNVVPAWHAHAEVHSDGALQQHMKHI